MEGRAFIASLLIINAFFLAYITFTLQRPSALKCEPDENPSMISYESIQPSNLYAPIYDPYFPVNPKNACRPPRQGIKHVVPILVHSDVKNFRARNDIRKTYGKVLTFKNWYLPVIFVIGTDESSSKDALLILEIETYGDIIVADFEDTFRHKSYKHLAGLRWATKYCSNGEFYIKTSDDYLVDVFRAVALMQTIGAQDVNYYCQESKFDNPNRDKGSKFYVSRKDFPAKFYPDFCLGMYIVRIETVRRTYDAWASGQIPYLFLDDIFVTGIIREYLNREDVYGIQIENKLSNHSLTKWRQIDRALKNVDSSYIEIYNVAKGYYACDIWKRVMKARGLMRYYKNCQK